jgi:hypothetical protein
VKGQVWSWVQAHGGSERYVGVAICVRTSDMVFKKRVDKKFTSGLLTPYKIVVVCTWMRDNKIISCY